MAKDPAFLFYSSDFITGTVFMTDEQVGKYIRLLCMQHQKGHLRKEHMLHICRSYDEDIFSKFDKDDAGLYFNKRLEEEASRRNKYCESRRQNKAKDMSKHMSTHMSSHMENENENTNENIKETNQIKKSNKVFIRPEIADVREYCNGRDNDVDPVKFFNFYEAKGWMVGKNKMKNWKAAVCTWEKD